MWRIGIYKGGVELPYADRPADLEFRVMHALGDALGRDREVFLLVPLKQLRSLYQELRAYRGSYTFVLTVLLPDHHEPTHDEFEEMAELVGVKTITRFDRRNPFAWQNLIAVMGVPYQSSSADFHSRVRVTRDW